MPRQRRNVFPGQDIHTIFRSVDNSFLFPTRAEHNVMTRTLWRMKLKYNCPLYAWVGMSNHHHIFNQSPTEWPEGDERRGTGEPIFIGDVFRDSFSMFARWVNIVRKRVGGVIRDRTKTVHVKSYEQAMMLLIYIFLNPVRAGIVKHPKDYPHHNFLMYAQGKVADEHKGLFRHHPAYLALGNTWALRRHRFMALVERALQEWAGSRWVGISSSHGPGRNKKKNAYQEFVDYAQAWVTLAKHALKGQQGQAPPAFGP